MEPSDTVATLKNRLNKELGLGSSGIDIERQNSIALLILRSFIDHDVNRPMYPTLHLSYALSRANNASGFIERHSKTHCGMLFPDVDHVTLAELGIRNADECRLSLTCDM